MVTPNVPGVGIPHLRADAQYGAPTKRVLRTVTPEDEDRGYEGLTKWLWSTDEMKSWLKNGETTDAVFLRLNQNGRVHNSLSDPAIPKLAKYISRYNKKFHAQETMVGTLTRAYSDEGVARMIQAEMGSRDKTTKALAEKLAAEQNRLWFSGESNSPLEIFQRLNLVNNNAGFSALRGDAYEAGLRYLAYFKRHTRNDISVFQVLREGYGNHQLAIIIERGVLDRRVSATARSMRRAQFKYWDEELMVMPENVYSGVFNLQQRPTDIDEAIRKEYFEYLRTVQAYGANH
ncbi:Eukaryotic translation initiation factor 3 subunit K [Phytophthora cinnamomi]|uniref:Eukaryotic translation initiation factor 3 subunit K n=1 Tax=Phytophthora cinnamomi TaxID=4785 RepID=UPI0035596725|nr:Eukaryotic translation initiation factor 3 subunit K [Phytophthora cinnamomi]